MLCVAPQLVINLQGPQLLLAPAVPLVVVEVVGEELLDHEADGIEVRHVFLCLRLLIELLDGQATDSLVKLEAGQRAAGADALQVFIQVLRDADVHAIDHLSVLLGLNDSRHVGEHVPKGHHRDRRVGMSRSSAEQEHVLEQDDVPLEELHNLLVLFFALNNVLQPPVLDLLQELTLQLLGPVDLPVLEYGVLAVERPLHHHVVCLRRKLLVLADLRARHQLMVAGHGEFSDNWHVGLQAIQDPRGLLSLRQAELLPLGMDLPQYFALAPSDGFVRIWTSHLVQVSDQVLVAARLQEVAVDVEWARIDLVLD